MTAPVRRQQNRSSALTVLGITFAAFALLLALIGTAAPGVAALAAVIAVVALVLSVIELCSSRSGPAVVAVLLSVAGLMLAFLVGVLHASGAGHTATYLAPAAPTAPSTYSYPTQSYTPAPTYTPETVYVAPTTTTRYTPPPPPKPRTFTYRVTGASVASMITYSTGGMNQAQDSNMRTPWRKTVSKGTDSDFEFGYVSAQNAGGGSISCTLTDDETGQVIAENTATGPYAIVSCTNA